MNGRSIAIQRFAQTTRAIPVDCDSGGIDKDRLCHRHTRCLSGVNVAPRRLFASSMAQFLLPRHHRPEQRLSRCRLIHTKNSAAQCHADLLQPADCSLRLTTAGIRVSSPLMTCSSCRTALATWIKFSSTGDDGQGISKHFCKRARSITLCIMPRQHVGNRLSVLPMPISSFLLIHRSAG